MRRLPSLVAVAASAVLLAACSSNGGKSVVSSRSYKGHASEKDTTNFVNAYPATVGTRLDDCQTCHTGGTLTPTGSGDPLTKNACDFCHLIQYPATGYSGQPATYADTLNSYGAAYDAGGRTKAALLALDAADSDGDGSANGVEIAALKYPGDGTSKPGQPNAPQKVFTLAQVQALAQHSEFLLANAKRQPSDEYVTYTGVKLKDLLSAAGVSLADPSITGVTVISPDGFKTDVPIADINRQFPAGQFHAGLDVATLGANCGFVTYPSPLPNGVVDNAAIPGEQWILIGYQRDGGAIPMDPSSLDATSGKINGEGPFRLVWPQDPAGWPDRGSAVHTTCGDGLDYDGMKDHNAGRMSKGVIAIRVNPLPAGYEDFDAKNGGWAYIENSTLVIYGNGIQ